MAVTPSKLRARPMRYGRGRGTDISVVAAVSRAHESLWLPIFSCVQRARDRRAARLSLRRQTELSSACASHWWVPVACRSPFRAGYRPLPWRPQVVAHSRGGAYPYERGL